MRHGTAIVCGFVDAFMLTWGVIALGACIYFSVVVGAAADEIVEEIPTGILERFRKAAQPVPFMQPVIGQNGVPMMSAPMPPMQPAVQTMMAPPPMSGPVFSGSMPPMASMQAVPQVL